MKDLFSIAGKVAIITGGSRGLGEMIARGFVENGATTYITARHEDELANTAKSLSTHGKCIAIVADFSSLAGIAAFCKTMQEREQSIDILVNNAGTAWGESFSNFPEMGWDKVMNLNVKSPFFLTQQLYPLLKKSASKADPARVINIASINGMNNPRTNNYSYSASKAAVIQMTRHLAADLVADNVNINAIAPGFFYSKLTAYAIDENEQKFVAQNIPKQRMGEAEDIAGTAIYLCSKASNWVTGQTIVVDGGVIACSGYGQH